MGVVVDRGLIHKLANFEVLCQAREALRDVPDGDAIRPLLRGRTNRLEIYIPCGPVAHLVQPRVDIALRSHPGLSALLLERGIELAVKVGGDVLVPEGHIQH